MNDLTPMYRQWAAAKREYPDVLLMFRMGDFYEMFGEDAEIGAREKRVVAIDTEIKSKLGAAPEAIVNGWKLTFRLQRRKETILPATEMRVLRVKESRAKGDAA